MIADGERAPSWFQRYRFYTRGRVPRGYDDWARQRLSLGRWIVVYLLIEAVAWAVVVVAVVAVSGGSVNPVGAWPIAAAAAAIAPFSARYYRNRARRALAPPPSRQVLQEIGERVPPGP